MSQAPEIKNVLFAMTLSPNNYTHIVFLNSLVGFLQLECYSKQKLCWKYFA